MGLDHFHWQSGDLALVQVALRPTQPKATALPTWRPGFPEQHLQRRPLLAVRHHLASIRACGDRQGLGWSSHVRWPAAS